MDKTIHRKCKDCKWWDECEKAGGLGQCRKNAPTTTNYDDGLARHIDCHWPEVVEDDWCGEFNEKAEEGLPRITAEDIRKGTCYPVNPYG